jgi:coenzyme F420-dependent glucose-6-phosphate dehydrogenase
MKIGYHLSSEEHPPNDLVRNARNAEEAGFDFAMISDHFHPWIDRQGHSPFVWAVIGGIAHATNSIEVLTSVTCPTVRTHPAIIAQAAATAGSMMPGRFSLGVGSGEALNEHIFGDPWPRAKIRLEMLEEAVQVIRELWKGDFYSHEGDYYIVEEAKIYDVPEDLPSIMMAAAGEVAASLAGKVADGLIATGPDKSLVKKFQAAGGEGKPLYGKTTVCLASTQEDGEEIAHRFWPNTGIGGDPITDLSTPKHFEAVTSLVTKQQVAESILCKTDPESHIQKLNEYRDAGFDHICVHQVGPDQDRFFEFYEKEILPNL